MMPSSTTRTYCDYLQIPTPAVADYIGRGSVRPMHLFVLTILVHGRPMTLAEVAEYLSAQGWIPFTGNPVLSLTKAWAGRLPIVHLKNGLLDLNLNCIELRMRLFDLGIRAKFQSDAVARSSAHIASSTEQAKPPKRILMHALRFEEQLVALTLLDLDQRSLQTLYDDELNAVPEKLREYSVIIGLEPRSILTDLRIDHVLDWRLIDLAHHPRSKQLNKRGRKLHITTEMLITSSTGISKPLGSPVKLHEYWTLGKRSMLTKRLESDAKALHAFYRYGALHNSIRLRWGLLSDGFAVEWGVPGEPCMYEVLKEKIKKNEPVEFVQGSAPGWKDPWTRAIQATVQEINFHDVILMVDGEPTRIPREEFQAVR